MPYDDKTGMWTPDAGSSTADKVTGLLANGNPYIEQAKQSGMEFANSRGLGNSSIAAGATQKAAYDAAVPIATADANIAASKDLSKQSFVQTTGLNAQQIAATKDLQTGQIASSEKIAGMGNASSERIAQIGASTQTTIAGMNIDAAAKQQIAAIISQEKQTGMQIAATASGQQLDLAQREREAQLSSATQQAIASMNISDADKQQLLALASQEKRDSMTQATQLQIANMNVSSNQQDKAAAASASYASVYASMVNAINSNTAIPADARAAYLENAKTLYNNGMSLVEQTYNVHLDWGQGSASATGSPAPVAGGTSNAGVTDQGSGYAINGDGIPVDENGRPL